MTDSLLRSQFLRALRDEFAAGKGPYRVDHLTLTEEENDSVLDESLEIVGFPYRVYVYQLLRVRGDQIAAYEVRESVKKRSNKLVLRITEFPVPARPAEIVRMFWRASSELSDLGERPGESERDRQLLQSLANRWTELAAAEAH